MQSCTEGYQRFSLLPFRGSVPFSISAGPLNGSRCCIKKKGEFFVASGAQVYRIAVLDKEEQTRKLLLAHSVVKLPDKHHAEIQSLVYVPQDGGMSPGYLLYAQQNDLL